MYLMNFDLISKLRSTGPSNHAVATVPIGQHEHHVTHVHSLNSYIHSLIKAFIYSFVQSYAP